MITAHSFMILYAPRLSGTSVCTVLAAGNDTSRTGLYSSVVAAKHDGPKRLVTRGSERIGVYLYSAHWL